MTGDPQSYLLHRGNVLDAYQNWPPMCIISDGTYGLSEGHAVVRARRLRFSQPRA